jgi:hypothetical protein
MQPHSEEMCWDENKYLRGPSYGHAGDSETRHQGLNWSAQEST